MTAEPLDLAAIRARVEAATGGPWEVDDSGFEVEVNDSTLTLSLYIDREPASAHERAHGPKMSPEDATFIAHARTDIPALLGLVEHLLADGEHVRRERNDYLAEVERLRAAIEVEMIVLDGNGFTGCTSRLRAALAKAEVTP